MKKFIIFTILYILSIFGYAALASAQDKTTTIQGAVYRGPKVEMAEIYRNIPVPPAGYIHGAVVDTIIQYYLVESEGRVYKVLPHNSCTTCRNNVLKNFAPGDKLVVRIDSEKGRVYVIVYPKKDLNKEYRYDIVSTEAK